MTLTKCWSNAGPPSVTLAQHQTSTGSTSCVCWAAFNPVKKKHLYNICTMLGQRWADVVQMLCTNVLCLLGIAAGLVLLNTAGGDYKLTPTQCLVDVEPVLGTMHSVLVSTSCCGYGYLHAGGMVTML